MGNTGAWWWMMADDGWWWLMMVDEGGMGCWFFRLNPLWGSQLAMFDYRRAPEMIFARSQAIERVFQECVAAMYLKPIWASILQHSLSDHNRYSGTNNWQLWLWHSQMSLSTATCPSYLVLFSVPFHVIFQACSLVAWRPKRPPPIWG
jgi:hypothetical protein